MLAGIIVPAVIFVPAANFVLAKMFAPAGIFVPGANLLLATIFMPAAILRKQYLCFVCFAALRPKSTDSFSCSPLF